MSQQQESKQRVLKVEEIGDFWRKHTIPRIRLKGKWLSKAGFPPNSYVSIESPNPGVLVVHSVDIALER